MDIKQIKRVKELFIEMNKDSSNFKEDVKRVKKELKTLNKQNKHKEGLK